MRNVIIIIIAVITMATSLKANNNTIISHTNKEDWIKASTDSIQWESYEVNFNNAGKRINVLTTRKLVFKKPAFKIIEGEDNVVIVTMPTELLNWEKMKEKKPNTTSVTVYVKLFDEKYWATNGPEAYPWRLKK